MIEKIIRSDVFINLVTLFGFLAVLYQICRSSKDAKASRTIDLMGRYYCDYHDLVLWPKDGSIPVGNGLEIYTKNYEKQLNFLYELARYWGRGLVDKQTIRDELSTKIAFETFNLLDIHQRFYKDEKQYLDRLRVLVEMRDEIVAIDRINYKLVKFWKKMGIKKYYFP